ncbi:hypothetical protein [Daejeonella sp.]|jgi:hypothetical protein|uniref:hypothetical protein n=1 Tax=Daejeonella sp. TaxID=2805397 RepID=UPI0037C04587
MKNLLRIPLFLLAVILLTSAIPPIKSDKVAPSEPKDGITLREILKLSPKQYTEITGEKLSFKDKLAFSYMKKELSKNESLDLDKKVDLKAAVSNGSGNFDLGGFIIGFLLGIIGVGLVYIFSTDSAMRSSSWKGFGAWIILLLLFFGI